MIINQFHILNSIYFKYLRTVNEANETKEYEGLSKRLQLYELQFMPLNFWPGRIPYRHLNKVLFSQYSDEQYCYCVVSDDSKQSGVIIINPETADFEFNRKLYLGQVEMMKYRFKQIIRELNEEFTCGKYHMFNYNCNHFSNEFSKRLLNIEIPKWIFRSTNILGYLCCCLPKRFTNGQIAFEMMMQEQRKKDQMNKELIQRQGH